VLPLGYLPFGHPACHGLTSTKASKNAGSQLFIYTATKSLYLAAMV